MYKNLREYYDYEKRIYTFSREVYKKNKDIIWKDLKKFDGDEYKYQCSFDGVNYYIFKTIQKIN